MTKVNYTIKDQFYYSDTRYSAMSANEIIVYSPSFCLDAHWIGRPDGLQKHLKTK